MLVQWDKAEVILPFDKMKTNNMHILSFVAKDILDKFKQDKTLFSNVY